ncbi:hypothetical protein JCM11491_002877 [Sporobolomyces phaffii]
MSTAPRAVASASQSIAKAVPTPRRVSKRTQRSSPTAALSSLISLYHLAPTFVPTESPARLHRHVTSVLAPARSTGAHPRPHHLIDLVYAANDLDRERTKLDRAADAAPPSLLGVKLEQHGYAGESFANLPSLGGASGSSTTTEGLAYDHKGSFFATHHVGQEPPLARRVRLVVDSLHGTSAGGRAGLAVVREHGAKAVEWKEGLRDARAREKEREAQEDREAEAFGNEFAA